MFRASSVWEDAVYNSGTGAKELEDREPASGQPALEEALPGDGSRAYGPHLGDGRAAQRVATSINQLLIGRLPNVRQGCKQLPLPPMVLPQLHSQHPTHYHC